MMWHTACADADAPSLATAVNIPVAAFAFLQSSPVVPT